MPNQPRTESAGGTVEYLSLGPGVLRVAPVGAEEPELTAAGVTWPAGWVGVGYTEDGTSVGVEVSREPVNVAEEIDPVLYATTSRSTTVSFAMAEITARNLALALNTVHAATAKAAGVVSVTPPDPGEERSVALAWVADTADELWVFRRASSSGKIAMARKKGTDKATIPVEFNVEKVSGKKAFEVFYTATRSGGVI